VNHVEISPLQKAWHAALAGALRGARTAVWLLAIMVPVSFLVYLLQESGLMAYISFYAAGVFGLVGLPGEAALVFVTAALMNNYSAIAVIGTLQLAPREVTIVALMCLVAHNLLVELPVMRSTGSSLVRMGAIRIGTAFVAAWIANALLPLGGAVPTAAGAAAAAPSPIAGNGAAVLHAVISALPGWLFDTARLVLTVSVIVISLMAAVRALGALGVIERLGKLLRPLMRFFGLPAASGYLWLVSNTLGLAYGAAVLREGVEDGTLSRPESDLLNHHFGMSHSLAEDTLLYAAIGVPVLPIVVPRLLFALAAVWERRAERRLCSLRTGAIDPNFTE